MANVTLTTPAGTVVELWQVQEDRDKRDGGVDVSSFPTFDSDDAYLTGLTEKHTAQLSGRATGRRLSQQPGYDSDPITALAEWVQEVDALLDGQQGTGYTLTHPERDYDRSVILESFGWTRSGGDALEVQWDLAYKIGSGVMVSRETRPGAATPSSTWTLDGVSLQYPIQYREAKSQQLDVVEMLYADDAEENIIFDQASPTRRVTITGRHKGTLAERRSFDEHFRGLIGQDQIVEYASAFPGHTLSVMVNNYESTIESGWTRLGEYSLELIEGTN